MSTFRPLSDWLLVKYDPPQKRSSIIEIAGDNDTSAVRTGYVVSVGPGKPLAKGGTAPVDLKVGDHVAFLRWHDEHRPGKQLAAALRDLDMDVGDDIMLIRQSDVLFIFEGDLRVDI